MFCVGVVVLAGLYLLIPVLMLRRYPYSAAFVRGFDRILADRPDAELVRIPGLSLPEIWVPAAGMSDSLLDSWFSSIPGLEIVSSEGESQLRFICP